MDEMLRYLKALVVMQAEALSAREAEGTKPELLLQRAGFKITEIAQMLGKPYTAVAKAISRARTVKSQAVEGE